MDDSGVRTPLSPGPMETKGARAGARRRLALPPRPPRVRPRASPELRQQSWARPHQERSWVLSHEPRVKGGRLDAPNEEAAPTREGRKQAEIRGLDAPHPRRGRGGGVGGERVAQRFLGTHARGFASADLGRCGGASRGVRGSRPRPSSHGPVDELTCQGHMGLELAISVLQQRSEISVSADEGSPAALAHTPSALELRRAALPLRHPRAAACAEGDMRQVRLLARRAW